MSFADLETRANAAVMRRLSNARATKVGGSGDFPVIFDYGFLEIQGISARAPLATALDSDITAQALAANSSQITINAATFTLRDIQPDGTGLSVLVLEVA